MKLRNKKTGKIVDSEAILFNCFNSLAELTEEWEDYEEPKDNGYWYIDDLGRIQFSSEILDELEGKPNNWLIRKLYGNIFETREEAEKVVEKLKAWKRLKDECDIKFDGIIRDDNAMLKGVKLSYDRHNVTFERMRECLADLYLIFGGEDD